MEAYLMCGAPGSGKSTYISRNLPNAVVVSGDNVRAELYGDPSIQGNWMEIQRRMVEIIAENVGKDIVIDGTHCLKQYRDNMVAILADHGYTKVTAILVDKPLEVCLKQNASRSRQVPEEVIRKMHHSFRESTKNIINESFYRIEHVY
jgi:predicted kinase